MYYKPDIVSNTSCYLYSTHIIRVMTINYKAAVLYVPFIFDNKKVIIQPR